MKIFLILSAMLSAFIIGLAMGVYKFPPFQLILEAKKIMLFESSLQDMKFDNFDNCRLPQVSVIEDKSHVFIGHAYGSPSKSNNASFISPNAQTFIKKNSSNLSTLVFTGDVFYIPSIKKWTRLTTELGQSSDIFIAPGNHDIARSDSLDIFEMSRFGGQQYPVLTHLSGTPLIIENSVDSSWNVPLSTVKLANSIDSSEIIIARHNVPIEDLLSLANGHTSKPANLDLIQHLTQKLDPNKSYYWIIGDSGAHRRLPRLSCLKYGNHTFILNGLGGVEGDSVIIYTTDGFSQYELS